MGKRLRTLRRLVLWVLATPFVAPIPLLLLLRFLPPPTTAFMVENSFGWLGDGEPCTRVIYGWTPLEEISPWVGIAVVAAEDQLFPYHHGLDVEAIRKALGDHDRGRRLRGASTITQQTAKNLFLWPRRSLVRKGLEAYLALAIEALWPKDRILEVYLNVAQFGPCTFGVTDAAREFWHKAPSELTLTEASLLATVLPDPFDLRADRPGPWTSARAAWVRRQVVQLGGPGYLTDPPAEPPGPRR